MELKTYMGFCVFIFTIYLYVCMCMCKEESIGYWIGRRKHQLLGRKLRMHEAKAGWIIYIHNFVLVLPFLISFNFINYYVRFKVSSDKDVVVNNNEAIEMSPLHVWEMLARCRQGQLCVCDYVTPLVCVIDVSVWPYSNNCGIWISKLAKMSLQNW